MCSSLESTLNSEDIVVVVVVRAGRGVAIVLVVKEGICMILFICFAHCNYIFMYIVEPLLY
jgi:hypothetical protein